MPGRDTNQDELIPIGEAARAAGVSIDTMRRWETEGKVTSVRTPGNQRRYRRADIDSLLAAS